MNRFTIPKKNRWDLGDTYMPFFIWHNKVYPVGVPVTLTELGKGAIAHRYEIFSVTLKAHYFDRHLEKWSYCYDGQNQHVFPYKNLNGIEYDTCFGTPDEYIASVEAEPLDVDVQEYLDFIKNHTENYYDRHPTFEEEYEIKEAIKNGRSPRSVMPERFKDDPEMVPKPIFKDWEHPELILGWILIILFIIAMAIFKDWYIQLIFRLYGIWQFSIWRRKKLYGINDN